jgi:hypothetical protein
MLWKFRYRDKFTAQDLYVEGQDYDVVFKAAEGWCAEREFRFIPNTLHRFVAFTVNEDGSRTQHDVTGAVVEKPSQSPDPEVRQARKVGRPRMHVASPAEQNAP